MKTRITLLTTLVLSALMVPSLFAAETSALPVAPYNFITTTVTSNADGTLTATNKQGDVLREIKHIYLGDDGSTAARGKFYHTSIEPLYYRIFRYEDTVNKPKEHTLAELNDHYIKFDYVDKDGKVSGSTVDLQGLNTGNGTENAHYQYFGLDMTKDMADGTVSKAELTIDNGLYQGDLNELTGSRLTKDKLSIFKAEGEQQYDDEGNDITKKYVTDYDRHGVSIADENGNIRFTTSGINAGNQKIEGVAAGVADTDAVNVKQLNDKIGALKDNDTITNVTAGPNITVVKSTTQDPNGMPAEPTFNVSLTPDVAINSANFSNTDTNIETDITATGVSVNDPNGSRASMNNQGFNVHEGDKYGAMQNDHIHFGDTSKNESADYSLKGIYLADNDSDPINITKENISFGGRQLHDVAAGTADTDAVNVKQLKDSIANIKDNDTITTVVAGDNIAVTSNGHDYTVSLDQATKDKINSIDGLKSDVEKAKNTVSAGSGVTVNETTNANGSTNYEVSVDKALVDQVNANKNGIDGLNGRVGKNADAIQANKDAIRDLQVGLTAAGTDVTGKGPIKVRRSMVLNGGSTFEVSLDQSTTDQIKANKDGIDGLNAKVADNANGIKANADAIKANKDNIALNKAAIDQLADRVVNGTNTLDNKINDVQKESRRGVASASALAALHPLDYNPDHKVDVMAGLGHYRGKTAAAIGAAYRPNENVMFTIGTSINGKDTAINAGVSYKVGAKDSTYRSQAAMAKDIDDLKAMVNKLHEENSDLKAIIYNMQGK